MRREDIFSSSRVSPRCLPKAKLFVKQLGEIARDIAPVISRAKECLDEWDYRPSDRTHTMAETQMLHFTQKMQLTMKAIEYAYEKSTKGVKTIFNRDVTIELFISMIQEYLNNGGTYVR